MSDQDNLLARTKLALGEDLTKKISEQVFCIVGCGAVGSLFAEMLVRTGATKFYLIDGDSVERSNLNRSTAFIEADVGKDKVEVLKKRLMSIVGSSPINVTTYPNHFRVRIDEQMDDIAEKAYGLVTSADVVIIAMDDNKPRIFCENLCSKKDVKYMSVGVEIKAGGKAFYECSWMLKTPKKMKNEQGYGEHGSYASIVMEATSAGFGMLLNHLLNEESKDGYVCREHDCFIPSGVSKSNTLFHRFLNWCRKGRLGFFHFL